MSYTIKDILFYCSKVSPFMALYRISAHNLTAHKILKNEVDLILPKFIRKCRNKRGIFEAIISGFVDLAFEGILSFLHHKRHNASKRWSKQCLLQWMLKEIN